MSARDVLIYDGDCAFCTRSARWGAERFTRFPVIRASQSFKDGELATLGLSRSQVLAAVYLVDTDGKTHSGAAAIAKTLAQQPQIFWRLAGFLMQLPGLRRVAEAGYRLVAKNRHRLPGASETCEVETN